MQEWITDFKQPMKIVMINKLHSCKINCVFQAKSSDDAEEGLLFMQEMIELSKLQQEQPENPPRLVTFDHYSDEKLISTVMQAGPAQFGLDLKGDTEVWVISLCILWCLFPLRDGHGK